MFFDQAINPLRIVAEITEQGIFEWVLGLRIFAMPINRDPIYGLALGVFTVIVADVVLPVYLVIHGL